ncbi:MAG: hypothetical protein JWM23_83 [Microbacteriaceae bacterium]|jgi:hypothetical protein|nr:hypothetical protein [Microbacteriaceae bacterium]
MTSPDSPESVYVAEFIDGPFEGRTETRALVRGRHEPQVSMMAAVESMESVFWYNEVDSREVQGELHVRYAFDARDSDPVAADDDQKLDEV